MKRLGVDWGEKHVGLAVSDETGLLARPLKTLKVKNRESLLMDLQKVVWEENIQEVIVGLPLSDEGRPSEASQKVEEFARRWQDRLPCPLRFQNEHLSTWQAAQEGDARQRKKLKNDPLFIHQKAACVLLQDYLDACR